MADEHQIGGTEQYASDEALILRVRDNCSAAYAHLYERHSESAQATAFRHARNPDDAEDLVAGGFANVL